MGWLNDITGYLTKVVENRIALAILVGLVFSLALTQWIKFILLRTKWLPDPEVWIIQAVALPIGAVPTFLILPDSIEWVVRLLIGVCVGAIAPYAYRVVTAVLYRLWPGLEQRLSVDPYSDKP